MVRLCSPSCFLFSACLAWATGNAWWPVRCFRPAGGTDALGFPLHPGNAVWTTVPRGVGGRPHGKGRHHRCFVLYIHVVYTKYANVLYMTGVAAVDDKRRRPKYGSGSGRSVVAGGTSGRRRWQHWLLEAATTACQRACRGLKLECATDHSDNNAGRRNRRGVHMCS